MIQWPTKIIIKNILIATIIVIFLFWSYVCQIFLTSFFDLAKTSTSRWPYFSTPHLQLAEALFNTGSTKYQQELELAKTGLFKNQLLISNTENLLTKPEQVQQQIDYWLSFPHDGIDSPQVYLRLSLLEYQRFNHQKARQYWQKANYLDPNDKSVKEIGEIISQ